MTKGYVVLQLGYEYNDEGYHLGEGENYAAPQVVYTDKAVAEAKRQELEIQAWRTHEVYGYFDDGLESALKRGISSSYVIDYIKEHIHPDFNEEDELMIPDKATDKAILGLTKLFDLKFYTIKEVKIQ